jgi:hypothetical protein
LAEDLEGLKSSDAVKSTGDAGGVTIKKFTVNTAKEQLILEFNIGPAKKKEGEAESKVGGKSKAAPASTKKPARAGICPYDSIPEVSSVISACFCILEIFVSRGEHTKHIRICICVLPITCCAQVTDQIVEDVLALLKEQGVSVEGKEVALRTKLAGNIPILLHSQ